MAAKSKIKRTNQSAPAPEVKDSIRTDEEPQHETNEASTVNEEVECQISTVEAMSEMELEHLLTSVRLLRSYISEEHLQLPVSQFCKQHLPNLSLVKDGIDGHFSLRWKEEDGRIAVRNGDTGDFPASLLHHIAMGYPKFPNLSAAVPSFGGLQISSRGTNKNLNFLFVRYNRFYYFFQWFQSFASMTLPAVNSSLLGGDALRFGNYPMREPSNMQTFGLQDGLHTPGVCSQRMSVGMTPKTQRLPKPGEMLLSVRGSPLGVYKEDNVNLEAISDMPLSSLMP